MKSALKKLNDNNQTNNHDEEEDKAKKVRVKF